MNIDFDFQEIERSVIKKLNDQNRRVSKALYPSDIAEISAKVAVLTIQEYHRRFHQNQQDTQ